MKRACIVTVDATRARICLYQEQAKPGFEMTEYRDLTNPGRRMKGTEMFSEDPGMAQHGGLKRGAPQGRAGSVFGEPGAAYDDHREAHLDEMDTRFAKEIVETLGHVLRDKQMGHLILCASPRMMGVLRATGGLDRPDLRVDELSSDLSNLGLAQLHDQLASRDLIPPRARLAMAR